MRIKVGRVTKRQLMILAGGHETAEFDFEAQDAAIALAEKMDLFKAPADKVEITDATRNDFEVLAGRLVAKTFTWTSARSAGQVRKMLAAALGAI